MRIIPEERFGCLWTGCLHHALFRRVGIVAAVFCFSDGLLSAVHAQPFQQRVEHFRIVEMQHNPSAAPVMAFHFRVYAQSLGQCLVQAADVGMDGFGRLFRSRLLRHSAAPFHFPHRPAVFTAFCANSSWSTTGRVSRARACPISKCRR